MLNSVNYRTIQNSDVAVAEKVRMCVPNQGDVLK